ncbi:MAG: hypothetical protein P4M00_16430 [Azospirillaceae bacterium]|nr:hypothetical protein [Azospirillaceae bacterium]
MSWTAARKVLAMQGFIAGAAAFSGGGAAGLGHRIIGNSGPEKLPSPDDGGN